MPVWHLAGTSEPASRTSVPDMAHLVHCALGSVVIVIVFSVACCHHMMRVQG
jgi:hypothetical protein